MARLPFPDHVRAMLDEPNPAVIATLRADGQPVTVATWYLMDGERVLVNMDEGRRRLDHLRRDARVTRGWSTSTGSPGTTAGGSTPTGPAAG